LLNLAALRAAPVTTEPFSFFLAESVLTKSDLRQVSTDFPPVDRPGVFPLSELRYGPAFARLIESIESEGLEQIVGEKFGLDLSDKPLMVTVRGQCQLKDGRIHTDSKDKLVTCLLYLNEAEWTEKGGNLRLLYDGASLDHLIAEVPPNGGNFVAFMRADNSWHGHASYSGRRRYIMFNWLRSNAVLAKNLGRHRLSAFAKRLGLFGSKRAVRLPSGNQSCRRSPRNSSQA
jgi:hypothetical protein